MAKILGLVLLVGAVWVGVEIYTNGMDGAFGGAFARFSDPAPAADVPRGSVAKRIGAKVQTELDGANERRMGEADKND